MKYDAKWLDEGWAIDKLEWEQAANTEEMTSLIFVRLAADSDM